ncbi:MAG: hypothetical protein JW929_15350 [Anaerolineales bacterium]|nr:hypothetical protein [Anaerolineales bacterium]
MNDTRTLKRIALAVWGICLLLILGMLVVWSGLADSAAAALFPAPTLAPGAPPTLTRTLTPTGPSTATASPAATATATFTPSITPTVTATLPPTPIPFASDPAVIGYSVAGRPIEAFRFGTGPVERLTIHGIHGGGEWNTIALADQLIQEITEHPEMIPEQVTLYIVRSLNPDGEARAHGPEGRANENGVDLNRNWDAYWQEKWDLYGCWVATPVTGGPYPFSEPESIAMRDFILEHHFDALINYHSAALGVFAAGQPPDPASVRLAKAIAAESPYQYPPIDTGCKYTGNLVDWAAFQGIAAVDLELLSHTNTDFAINLKVLDILLNFR